MLWDGQRGPGSHQVVTGVMSEAAGLAQGARGTHTEHRGQDKGGWREREGKERRGFWNYCNKLTSVLYFNRRKRKCSGKQKLIHFVSFRNQGKETCVVSALCDHASL